MKISRREFMHLSDGGCALAGTLSGGLRGAQGIFPSQAGAHRRRLLPAGDGADPDIPGAHDGAKMG